jgi:DNA-binding response OmpR family regulator
MLKIEKKKILLVDDDPDYLFQLSIALQDMGFTVITASTQKEAEDIIEKTPARPGHSGLDDGKPGYRLYSLPHHQRQVPRCTHHYCIGSNCRNRSFV